MFRFLYVLLLSSLLFVTNNVFAASSTKDLDEHGKEVVQNIGGVNNILQAGLSDVVVDLLPSVVNISTTYTVKSQPMFPEGSFGNSPFDDLFKEFFKEQMGGTGERQAKSLGSGFIISKDGYIVTNYHVIEQADEIIIKFNDDSTEEAEIIGIDKRTDIALLKVKGKTDLAPVKFGNSEQAKVGDFILAVGNPFGFGGSVNFGIISAKSRFLNINDSTKYNGYLQIDAAINRSNSGGPLFNMKGELIGVNNAIYSPNGGNVGIGFSIPIEIVEPVVEQLKDKGKVVRGWIGVAIDDVSSDVAKSLGSDDISGAYVVEVKKDSPADKAGIRPTDIIIEFDGHKINKAFDLLKYAPNTEIGKKVKVKVRRGNKVEALYVKVEKFSEDDSTLEDKNVIDDKNDGEKIMGMILSPLTKELKEELSLGKAVNDGLVVTAIDKDSLIYKSGVRVGDVLLYIGQEPVKSIQAFEDQVKKIEKSKVKYLSLIVHRQDRNFVVTIRLKK